MNTKNVKLLIERLEVLLDSPEAPRFNMRYFGNQWGKEMVNLLPIVRENPPVCKTQACLAGEAVLATGSGQLHHNGGIILTSTGGSGWEIESQAGKDLGLTLNQRRRLFFFANMNEEEIGWPKKFEEAYRAANTPQGRLYVAIRRVEHFLATKGRE